MCPYRLRLDYDDLSWCPARGENPAVTFDEWAGASAVFLCRQQWKLAINARAVGNGTLSSWMNPRDGSRVTLKIVRSAASPTCCAPAMTRHLRSFLSPPSWSNSLPRPGRPSSRRTQRNSAECAGPQPSRPEQGRWLQWGLASCLMRYS